MRGEPPARRERAGRRRAKCSAFTLIELTAVLALAAILTGTAAVSVNAYQRRGALRAATDELAWADAVVRSATRRSGVAGALSIDLATGRLTRGSTADSTAGPTGESTGRAASVAELPRGVRASRVVVADVAEGYGRVEVNFSAAGLSPSYAVLLEGPGRERTWVVFTGLTGQKVTLPDDPSTDAILRAPAFAGRPDAG